MRRRYAYELKMLRYIYFRRKQRCTRIGKGPSRSGGERDGRWRQLLLRLYSSARWCLRRLGWRRLDFL